MTSKHKFKALLSVALFSAGTAVYSDLNDVLSDGNVSTNTITVGSAGNTNVFLGKSEFGDSTTASGDGSFAQGLDTTASGDYSHAIGVRTTASGESSHTQGYETTASGIGSYAQGVRTTASGAFSQAAGSYAIAAHNNSYVWAGDDSLSTNNLVSSTADEQYTVHAANGTRLLGGDVEIEGNIVNSGFQAVETAVTSIETEVNTLTGDLTTSSVITPDGRLRYLNMLNGRPHYSVTRGGATHYVRFNGTEWTLFSELLSYTNPSQALTPPATGWVNWMGTIDPIRVAFVSGAVTAVEDDVAAVETVVASVNSILFGDLSQSCVEYTPGAIATFHSITNGRPKYTHGSVDISYTGGRWLYVDPQVGGVGSVVNHSTAQTPPSAGWELINGTPQTNVNPRFISEATREMESAIATLRSDLDYELPQVSFDIGSTTELIGNSTVVVDLGFTCNKPMAGREYLLGYVEDLGAGQDYEGPIRLTGATTQYQIEVTDERGAVHTDTKTVTFKNYKYVGASADTFAQLTNEDILDFNTSWATKGATGGLTTANQFVYICYPATQGACSVFKLNGFSFSDWPSETRDVTNSNGYVESYIIYHSINLTSEVSNYEVR